MLMPDYILSEQGRDTSAVNGLHKVACWTAAGPLDENRLAGCQVHLRLTVYDAGAACCPLSERERWKQDGRTSSASVGHRKTILQPNKECHIGKRGFFRENRRTMYVPAQAGRKRII